MADRAWEVPIRLSEIGAIVVMAPSRGEARRKVQESLKAGRLPTELGTMRLDGITVAKGPVKEVSIMHVQEGSVLTKPVNEEE